MITDEQIKEQAEKCASFITDALIRGRYIYAFRDGAIFARNFTCAPLDPLNDSDEQPSGDMRATLQLCYGYFAAMQLMEPDNLPVKIILESIQKVLK